MLANYRTVFALRDFRRFWLGASRSMFGDAMTRTAFIPGVASAAAGLFLLGFFDAPLTIWAQTLRMAIIPPTMRGRVFALIRLSINGFGPVGSALAGFLRPIPGVTAMILISAVAIGLPGFAGLFVQPLRRVHGPAPAKI